MLDSLDIQRAETNLDRFLDLPVEELGSQPALPASQGARPPRISYSHQGMAEYILANPWASQDQIAAHFGYSASWISTIICSDASQALLAKRRDELIDPVLRMSIKEQLDGILARSLEILRQKLDKPAAAIPDNLALQAAKVAAQAAGYGARTEQRSSLPPPDVNVHLTVLSENMVGLLRRQKRSITVDAIGEAEESDHA